ncbi:hypothetical protein ACJX0J_038117, partial [Zea mays]
YMILLPEFGSNLWAESRTEGLTWGSRLQGADALHVPQYGEVQLSILFLIQVQLSILFL